MNVKEVVAIPTLLDDLSIPPVVADTNVWADKSGETPTLTAKVLIPTPETDNHLLLEGSLGLG